RLAVPAQGHRGRRTLVRQLQQRGRGRGPRQAGPARKPNDRAGARDTTVPPHAAGPLHVRGPTLCGRRPGRGARPADRAGGAVVGAAISARGIKPRPHRPPRYTLAIAITVALIAVLVASSILNYVYLDTVAGRTSLYGLLSIALTALGTFIGVRGFDRDPEQRQKDCIRAGVLLGLVALRWRVLMDDEFVTI